jgi:hypothetical protein
MRVLDESGCAFKKVCKEVGHDVYHGLIQRKRGYLCGNLLRCVCLGTDVKLEPVGWSLLIDRDRERRLDTPFGFQPSFVLCLLKDAFPHRFSTDCAHFASGIIVNYSRNLGSAGYLFMSRESVQVQTIARTPRHGDI